MTCFLLWQIILCAKPDLCYAGIAAQAYRPPTHTACSDGGCIKGNASDSVQQTRTCAASAKASCAAAAYVLYLAVVSKHYTSHLSVIAVTMQIYVIARSFAGREGSYTETLAHPTAIAQQKPVNSQQMHRRPHPLYTYPTTTLLCCCSCSTSWRQPNKSCRQQRQVRKAGGLPQRPLSPARRRTGCRRQSSCGTKPCKVSGKRCVMASLCLSTLWCTGTPLVCPMPPTDCVSQHRVVFVFFPVYSEVCCSAFTCNVQEIVLFAV